MNHITILGRLTKDADVRYTPNNKVVATFTLAVDRPFSGEKKEADLEGHMDSFFYSEKKGFGARGDSFWSRLFR